MVNNLDSLTEKDFKDSIAKCLNMDMTTVAPLGASSDEINLNGFHGKIDGKWHRISLIQMRNYCGSPELLITDKAGNFLFYGQMDAHLDIDLIANFYYSIFKAVKLYITEDVGNTKVNFSKNVQFTAGFKMLNSIFRNENEEGK